MIKIDNSLLAEIGLGGLPDAEKNSFLKHVYETLEMRVGIRLADQMSNEQLDEFEHYFEAKDDAGAFKWLETNFPNYKDIVQQEFDKLKAEVAQTAPQILATSQAQAQPTVQQPSTLTQDQPVAPPLPVAGQDAPMLPQTPPVPPQPAQPFQVPQPADPPQQPLAPQPMPPQPAAQPPPPPQPQYPPEQPPPGPPPQQ